MVINTNALISGLTVASDLLNNLGAVDTVAIFDSVTLQQVLQEGRPMAAEVRETSMVMSHPVETGTILSDNHIINPIEIQMLMFVSSDNYNLIYGQLKQAFVAANSFTVQTRTGVYPNMIISDMPHREDSEMYDAIFIAIRFKEVLYVVPTSVSPATQPANFSPADPINSNTVQTGEKFPKAVSNGNATAVQSILTGFAFKIGGRL